jgi:hypothetical protein
MDTRTIPGLTDPSSNGDSIQSKLSQMQASLDSLLQSIRAAGTPFPLTQLEQPFSLEQASHSPSTDSTISRRGSDGGSNITAEELGASAGIEDTMRSLSGLQDAMQSLRARNPQSFVENATTEQLGYQYPLSPLSRNEAIGAIAGFREEVNTLYPFIDLVELSSLLDTIYSSVPLQKPMGTRTVGWSDVHDSRNLDLLKLIIACALAAQSKEENDLSHDLMKTVEEESIRRMNGPDVDMKDLAIAAMLVS